MSTKVDVEVAGVRGIGRMCLGGSLMADLEVGGDGAAG